MAIFEKKQPPKPQPQPQPQEIVQPKSSVPDDPARSSLHVESRRSPELERVIAQARAAQAAANPVAKPAQQPAPATPAQKTETPKQEASEEKASDAKDAQKSAVSPLKKRARSKQIKLRCTVEEAEKISQRVAKTGLTTSEFMRQAALTSRIVLPSNLELLASIDDQLNALAAEIGRQGGMLKMIVKPNKGMRELHPEEWEELTSAIRKLKYAQRDINTMREELKNGISTTQSEQ